MPQQNKQDFFGVHAVKMGWHFPWSIFDSSLINHWLTGWYVNIFKYIYICNFSSWLAFINDKLSLIKVWLSEKWVIRRLCFVAYTCMVFCLLESDTCENGCTCSNVHIQALFSLVIKQRNSLQCFSSMYTHCPRSNVLYLTLTRVTVRGCKNPKCYTRSCGLRNCCGQECKCKAYNGAGMFFVQY